MGFVQRKTSYRRVPSQISLCPTVSECERVSEHPLRACTSTSTSHTLASRLEARAAWKHAPLRWRRWLRWRRESRHVARPSRHVPRDRDPCWRAAEGVHAMPHTPGAGAKETTAVSSGAALVSGSAGLRQRASEGPGDRGTEGPNRRRFARLVQKTARTIPRSPLVRVLLSRAVPWPRFFVLFSCCRRFCFASQKTAQASPRNENYTASACSSCQRLLSVSQLQLQLQLLPLLLPLLQLLLSIEPF